MGRDQATKELFQQRAPLSRLLHFHGHVLVDEHPLNNAMIFHAGTPLKAREVFSMDLRQRSPLVVLIGCGSGTERFDTGDDPLGLISGFLFAGASAVVATLRPIHDRLSGAAFTESFCGYGCRGADRLPLHAGQVVDLARRLQMAAMDA
jgi:CHAT domain-containing protein